MEKKNENDKKIDEHNKMDKNNTLNTQVKKNISEKKDKITQVLYACKELKELTTEDFIRIYYPEFYDIMVQNYSVYKPINTISGKHGQYILEALSLAQKSTLQSRHGAVIVKNGKIISRGFNNWGSFTGEKKIKNYWAVHAEIDVLRRCDPRDLNGAILYVARLGSRCNDPNCNHSCHNSTTYNPTSINTLMLNSLPCSKCMNIINIFINKYNLHKVYYSFNSYYMYSIV